MEQKPPQITLTIFLIKIDATDIGTFFSDIGSLDHHSLKDGKTVIGDLYIKKPRPKPPGWGKFFRDYVDPKELGRV